MKNVFINEPSIKSDDAQWIQWHKDLKGLFGKKTANSVFLAFWKKRGSSAANTHDLRNYAESQGFKVEASTIAGVIDGAYDVVDGIGDFFKIGKIVTISVLVILVGGIGMLVFNIAKEPVKAISAARGGN
jgi:hypothetical protein